MNFARAGPNPQSNGGLGNLRARWSGTTGPRFPIAWPEAAGTGAGKPEGVQVVSIVAVHIAPASPFEAEMRTILATFAGLQL